MFYYRISFWDDTDQRQREESGLLAAKNYNEAMKRVLENYGEESIASVYLEAWEDVVSEDEILEALEQADMKV